MPLVCSGSLVHAFRVSELIGPQIPPVFACVSHYWNVGPLCGGLLFLLPSSQNVLTSLHQNFNCCVVYYTFQLCVSEILSIVYFFSFLHNKRRRWIKRKTTSNKGQCLSLLFVLALICPSEWKYLKTFSITEQHSIILSLRFDSMNGDKQCQL